MTMIEKEIFRRYLANSADDLVKALDSGSVELVSFSRTCNTLLSLWDELNKAVLIDTDEVGA